VGSSTLRPIPGDDPSYSLKRRFEFFKTEQVQHIRCYGNLSNYPCPNKEATPAAFIETCRKYVSETTELTVWSYIRFCVKQLE
jgi:hypothetical protein